MADNDLFTPTSESTAVTIEAGEIVFMQAKVNTSFFQLLEGAVLVQLDIDGQIFTVAKYSSDASLDKKWFGELPSGEQTTRSYQLLCLEDSTFACYEWSRSADRDNQSKYLLDEFAYALRPVRHAKTLHQCLLNFTPTISVNFLEVMLEHCLFVNVEPNHVIFQQGDPGTSAYFLLSGKLGVYVGNKDTQVGEVSRGELFGEMAVISGEERSATIIASRYSELAMLSTDSFQSLSAQFPQLNQAVISILMTRLRSQNERLERQNKPKNRVIVALSRHRLENVCPLQDIETALRAQSVDVMSSQTVVDNIADQSCFENIAPHRITALLESKEVNNKLNLFASYSDEIEWTHHCLKKADEVWLIINSTESLGDVSLRLAPFRCQPYWRNLKINVILTHKNTAIRDTGKWVSHIDADNSFHLVVNDTVSLARITRRLRDQANSLVLGGGGAKGFAHIGVIKALEEADIPIDSIGGTSIGAVMSGWVAMGFDAKQMTEAVQHYFVSANPLGDYTLPIMALSKSGRLDTLLHHSFQEKNIEDLPIPFFCMSSDLTIAQEKCHDKGKLWRAVRASLAIPGVITPAIDNGHFLVDGGLLNNLPCDLMNQRSNGPVIAIDVTDINNFDTELASMPSPWVTAWKKWVSRQEVAVPTILETLFRSSMLASYNKRNDNKRKVDYYIQPDVKDFSILEFTQAKPIIEKGYAAGMDIVEDLQKTLANIQRR